VKSILVAMIVPLLIVFSNSASAVTVMGQVSCGVWTRDRTAGGNLKHRHVAWLAGYLSGLALGDNKDYLKGRDIESLALWVDSYCHANPLREITHAGDTLVRAIAKDKGL
jgi:hypothetical protein